MKKINYFLVCLTLHCLTSDIIAQNIQVKFNGFGHVEHSLIVRDSTENYFSLGEHDFFVTSNLNKRISFLGEFTIRYNSNVASNFLPSIERAFIKFNYKNNHSIIGGKIHTPVNYWNDSYHHGRVFFPVIDRPFAFSYIIPLHTLGTQFQGQNIGDVGFGYDVVFGNGLSSTDVYQGDFGPSITAAFHIKPAQGLRIGASYYYNYLSNNTPGAHSGHAVVNTQNPDYKGPVSFTLLSNSISWFGKRWELLNEFSFNQTETEIQRKANNFSNFTYVGLRCNENSIPYILVDYISIAKNDLYTQPIEMFKSGLGFRYEFNYLISLKGQLEYSYSKQPSPNMTVNHMGGSNSFGFRVQLAYGF
jgi:hypothetical protein